MLNDKGLTATWGQELKEMSDRIIEMRAALVRALEDVKCPTPSASFTNWDHITSQIGMFAYTGLSKAQVRRRRRRMRRRRRRRRERERAREREREKRERERERRRETLTQTAGIVFGTYSILIYCCHTAMLAE